MPGNLWKENRPGASARNEILRATQRLGRDIWKRAGAGTTGVACRDQDAVHQLMGERIMARNFERQVAELQVRAAILNRFTQLGTPETVRVG